MTTAARADDPFGVNAQTTSGTPQSVTASGSSLPDLVSNLIKNQGQFSSLANQNISAGLRYGNLNNAILVTRNAAGTSATVSIPSINFSKVFTAANQHDLNKQIEDFARKNGANTYGRFIRSINQTSDLGIVDGNPVAATALMAGQAYRQFGLLPEPFVPGERWPDPLDQVATPRLAFDLGGGSTHSATGNGYFGSGAFSFGFRFGDRVGLTLTTPFMYRETEGANAFEVGEEVSLPIMIFARQGEGTLSNFLQKADVKEYWTPTAGVGIRFDEHAGLRVGYSGDFGHGFTVNGGSVQFYFNY